MIEIKMLPTIKEPSEKLVSSTNNSWNQAIRIEQKEEEERNKSGLKWRDSLESLSLHVLIIFFSLCFSYFVTTNISIQWLIALEL
jgi:hypothetical protein